MSLRIKLEPVLDAAADTLVKAIKAETEAHNVIASQAASSADLLNWENFITHVDQNLTKTIAWEHL